MTTKKKPPKFRVAVKAPKKVADLLVFSQKVHDQMGANAVSLPSPNPPLATLQGQIADLTTKEALAKTRASGAVEDRDQAQLVLEGSLRQEAAYVEVLCNASPDNAPSLVQDAGFSAQGQDPARQATARRQAGDGVRVGAPGRESDQGRPVKPVAVQPRRRQDVDRLAGDDQGVDDAREPHPGNDGDGAPAPLTKAG